MLEDHATTGRRPLRIGIVSQYFWPETFPINAMARRLADRGHSITVLTGLPNYPSGRIREGYGFTGPWRDQHHGIRIHRVPLVPRGQGSRLQLAANYASFAAASFVGAPTLLRGGFDVLLALQASPLLGVVGALSHRAVHGTPLVLWIQDLWPESLAIAGVKSRLVWRAMDQLMQMTYRRADLVFMQSKAFVPHAERYGVARERLVYIPNWADPVSEPMAAGGVAANGENLPAGFRVVIAGNIGEAQDVATLIAAARLLKGHPEIRICVLGDGRARPALQAAIEADMLHPTLQWLGTRPLAQMPYYFAAADALLLMLRRDRTMAKTIPSRLQAYLAGGRPIIAALDGEAQRIVVEAKAGLGVPAESPEELKNAIVRLYETSAAERNAMARAAADCARTEFDATLITDRAEAAFYRLADRAGNRQ